MCALNCNDSSQYVTLPSSLGGNGGFGGVSGAVTLMGWIKPSTLALYSPITGYVAGLHYFVVSSIGPGKPRVLLDNSGGTDKWLLSTSVCVVDVWNFVAISLDAGVDYTFCVNGVFDYHVDTDTRLADNGSAFIGHSVVGHNAACELAEVSLWNRALSQQEIQSYMHKKLTGGESGLVGYWPMDDAGIGTSVVIKDHGVGERITLLDNCEVADWTEGNAALAETVNAVNFTQGAGSLNMGKDGTQVFMRYDKIYTPFDATGKSLYFGLRFDNQADINKLHATLSAINVYSGADRYILYIPRASLSPGWNKIGGLIPDDFIVVGSPDITALDKIILNMRTINPGDLITLGDSGMDYYHLERTGIPNNGTMTGFSSNPWVSGPPVRRGGMV